MTDCSKFDIDPEALAWARGKAERLVDRLIALEKQAAQAGNPDDAKQWRVAARVVTKYLIGQSGCVIAAFDDRLPGVVSARPASGEVCGDVPDVDGTWVRRWSDGDLYEENGSVVHYAERGADTAHLIYTKARTHD
ncbi:MULTISPECIES: hypothetical protein [unclassified Microbacterium]|uniref:hypothetical protein n=1 Tax=unclassified Microbacterium TaxID=2609290 RepID=UPI002468D08C|nr:MULTISPECIES: hypothetical protein [unclassified Microbacterium]MDH5134051.1 hypothetical protein [Microbacterium sp. RD10]MDH5136845.1 hypothetical protein [Microbacterium sp. RD11]MDH5146891.1 hypothetical protein [Microbacterium sp. RD12]MDH5156583.1 hypothetical protein [Microbacterium sp. RD06]MDH5168078.1 hypothetical protein [Microbacterium sp. RD02]